MTRPLSTPARKRLVIDALDDIKARDILAIDVHKVTSAFDWIVVATAESARQTKALARHLSDKLREKGITIIGIEGEDSADWILVDAGDVVAHIMQPAVRGYYNLEELWGEGKADPVVNSSMPVSVRLVKAERRRPVAKKPAAKKLPAKKPAVKKPAVKRPAAKKRPRKAAR